MRVVCPGSFDPIHKGHMEVIARAAALFDEVIVGVAHNHSKKYLFSLEERLELVRAAAAELNLENVNVEVIEPGVLLSAWAHERGAVALVKGLRSGKDYEYEAPMASMNRHVRPVETLFLSGEDRYTGISSTIIREVASLGGDVSAFVPAAVAQALGEKFASASAA